MNELKAYKYCAGYLNLSDEQVKIADEFLAKHNDPKFCKIAGKNHGAIGGVHSFTITLTSIGSLVGISCKCGAHELLNGDEL